MFEDGLALDGFVELAEERNGFLGTRLANALLSVQEEVVSGISRGGDSSIKDGEVTDAGEDEVLEDRGGCGGCGKDEDARCLESCLARRGPDTDTRSSQPQSRSGVHSPKLAIIATRLCVGLACAGRWMSSFTDGIGEERCARDGGRCLFDVL